MIGMCDSGISSLVESVVAKYSQFKKSLESAAVAVCQTFSTDGNINSSIMKFQYVVVGFPFYGGQMQFQDVDRWFHKHAEACSSTEADTAK